MSALPAIVVIHGGTHFHLASLADPALRGYRITPVNLRELCEQPQLLEGADVVIVADRLRLDLLRQAAPILLEAHARGADLAVLGENNVQEWLPGIEHETRPTVFWWWRTGEDSRIRPQDSTHPARTLFAEKSLVWHYHGVLRGGPQAHSLVDLETEEGHHDGSLLLVDDSGPARLLVSAMDPFYHHGSGFMPGASQLIYAVFQWASRPEVASVAAS